VVARVLHALAHSWPGRVTAGSARTFIRIELFDRSMTVAAQFFTSVIPLLIVGAVWLSRPDSERFADWMSLPPESRVLLNDAIQGDSTATFGLIGFVAVLLSGTSLSRTLTRAYAALWELPRPRSSLHSAWRWVVVLALFALVLGVTPSLRDVLGDAPPAPLAWQLLAAVASYLIVAIVVPRLLLEGRVSVRQLMPGGVLFAAALIAARPAVTAYLPRALDYSATHYGSIGVAFTFISLLYLLAFVHLATSCIGWVIATDPGWLGSWVRSERALPSGRRTASG
jgi:membrane protein